MQHHHAHLAACLAEHGETAPPSERSSTAPATGPTARCGAGSCCSATCSTSSASACCAPVRMPGGEAAIRQPWRMACAWLDAPPQAAAAAALAVTRPRGARSPELARSGVASPLTTSAGRLFDAVAALCGVRSGGQLRGPGGGRAGGAARPRPRTARYRSRCATTAARRSCSTPVRRCARSRRELAPAACRWRRSRRASTTRSPRPRRRPARARPARAARRRSCCRAACSRTGACSSGPRRCCARAGLRVLMPEALPPNDGGIAYGQLAVAAARLAGGRCSGLTTGSPELADGEALLVVLAVALLLGLRHATDPDHLAAVSTLIASDPEDGTQRAGRLGLAWGAGHAHDARACSACRSCCSAPYLPESVQRAAEALVGRDDHVPRGSAAAALAARPLPRALAPPRRRRAPPPAPARVARRPPRPRARAGDAAGPIARAGVRDRPRARDGRVGGRGRAAAGDDPDRAEAVAALVVLALGTAVSMAMLSSAFGYAITRGPVLRRMLAFAPAMGVADARVRSLVRTRRGGGGPVRPVSEAERNAEPSWPSGSTPAAAPSHSAR